ncbi:Thiol-disulfide isomerase or thioredoxin [Lentibacillus persicus]|uniref:Thiol-disulfide isomerase or thioredoxin n=1 Tax=Lentibacillus persicus TaxID=640948 RepID=A0A1I1WF62_9BACI|nr:thioredoxin family protein [Lentibacillus persicus]SFD93816.1 Thiol-disulfide isomerase or thioredoxin [Lentibacillus persicus]
MDLNQWYEKGMDPDTYIEAMDKNKENLLHIYDNFTPPEDNEFMQKLAEKNLRVIVLTEDWCGDAMLNIPILLRISDQTNMPVKLLLRDNNLELMDHYLTNGKSRSIPIFIFIDESGNEVAKWGPRAEKIQQFVDDSTKKLPPKDADNYQEKAKEMYLFMSKTFRDNTDFWPDVYSSIKTRLENEANL